MREMRGTLGSTIRVRRQENSMEEKTALSLEIQGTTASPQKPAHNNLVRGWDWTPPLSAPWQETQPKETLRQERGRESHRFVQGPWHDRRSLKSPRAGKETSHLCLHRQHVCFAVRLRRQGRHGMHRLHPARQGRIRKDAPSSHARCQDCPGQRKL